MRFWRTLSMFMKTLSLCMLPFAGAGEARAAVPWAVYYSDKATAEEFLSYKLVVFDSDAHPLLMPLKNKGKTILGYLSVGEVNNGRKYFTAVKEEGLLLKENDNWKGSFMVDVRDSRWTKRVLEDLIPGILQQGFDGVFLDTLDNPPFLEQSSPTEYKGMKQAAVSLVRAMREKFPRIKIMMNRGYDILDDTAPYVDTVLGESVYATYNFALKKYELQPEDVYQNQVRILKSAQARNPKLQVFTLDYWEPSDKTGRAKIYKEERGNGFSPYVSTILLNEIVPE